MRTIRPLGTILAAAALILAGLTAAPAQAAPVTDAAPTAYTGCTKGLNFYQGTLRPWRSWSKCSLAGGKQFYAIIRCHEGWQSTGQTYPTIGKYTSRTVSGCPTRPRSYYQHITG